MRSLFSFVLRSRLGFLIGPHLEKEENERLFAGFPLCYGTNTIAAAQVLLHVNADLIGN
jgi:hypothetical protein